MTPHSELRDRAEFLESRINRTEEWVSLATLVTIPTMIGVVLPAFFAVGIWSDAAGLIAGYNAQDIMISNQEEKVAALEENLNALPAANQSDGRVVVNQDSPKANYISALSEAIGDNSEAKVEKVNYAIGIDAVASSELGDIFDFLPCPDSICARD